jgi:capsular polysaccharide biosynthesis protein
MERRMNFVNRIRRRLFWVLLLTIIGLGGGVGYSYTTSSAYNATARLFVATSARDAIEAAQGNMAGEERLKTYAVLGTGSELLERAAERSNTGVTGADLRSRLTIVPLPGTLLLEVRVKDENPNTAAAQADAVASELIDLVGRVEAPINGGDPLLKLITVQAAKSGVVPAGKLEYKIIAAGGGIGLVLSLILAGAIPERRLHPLWRRSGYEAKQADQRHDDILEPEEIIR